MSLVRRSAGAIAVKFTSILVGLISVAILARVLQPEEYGVYSVVFATVTILAVPSQLGLPNFVVREVSRAAVDDSPERTRQIVRAATRLVMLSSGGAIALAFAWTFLIKASPGYAETLIIGFLLVPVIAMTAVLGGVLRGLGYAVSGLLPDQVVRQAAFCGIVLGWVLIVGSLSSVSAMALHLAGALVALMIGALGWLRLQPRGKDCTPPPDISMRTMILSTGVMGIIAGAQSINSNLDVIMLGALTDSRAAGLYKVASTAAMLPVAGLQAINMVMMPAFARLHREGNREKLQHVAARTAQITFGIAAPISLVLILFGRWILELAFGAEYAASYGPMVILVVGQLINAAFGSVITILNMTGHEMDTLKGVLIAFVVNIVLNVALIPFLGAEGAAIASASTVVLWNIILFQCVRRRLSITTLPFRF
jgi:O-antigen/teichoic acid export membrane protein